MVGNITTVSQMRKSRNKSHLAFQGHDRIKQWSWGMNWESVPISILQSPGCGRTAPGAKGKCNWVKESVGHPKWGWPRVAGGEEPSEKRRDERIPVCHVDSKVVVALP